MQSLNVAKFVNITPLFILLVHFAASFAPSAVIIKFPSTIIYASHRLDLSIEV